MIPAPHNIQAGAVERPSYSKKLDSQPLPPPLAQPPDSPTQTRRIRVGEGELGQRAAPTSAVRHRPRPKRVDGRWDDRDTHARSHQSPEAVGGGGRTTGQAVG